MTRKARVPENSVQLTVIDALNLGRWRWDAIRAFGFEQIQSCGVESYTAHVLVEDCAVSARHHEIAAQCGRSSVPFVTWAWSIFGIGLRRAQRWLSSQLRRSSPPSLWRVESTRNLRYVQRSRAASASYSPFAFRDSLLATPLSSWHGEPYSPSATLCHTRVSGLCCVGSERDIPPGGERAGLQSPDGLPDKGARSRLPSLCISRDRRVAVQALA